MERIFLILFAVVISSVSLPGASMVWFIPGWLRCNAPQSETMDVLVETFGGMDHVRYYDWDGNTLSWGLGVAHAEEASRRLEEDLRKLSPEERSGVVLIGHSLGGRIVVRALAGLSRDGLKVGQGILLGAAIPYTDEDIPRAARGSSLPLMAVCNPSDVLLKYIYATLGGEKAPALGANGVNREIPNYEEHVVPPEIVGTVDFENVSMRVELIKKIANHHAKFYAVYLQRLLRGELPEFSQGHMILVPQGNLNFRMKVMNGKVWWNVLEACQGWELQQHCLTKHCRILNPENVREAWGDESVMRASFGKVRLQLEGMGIR